MLCVWPVTAANARLVAVAVIYITHDPGGTCAQQGTLGTYVLGCGGQLVVSVPLLVMLAVCSGRGAVMEPAARRAVTPLIHCRSAPASTDSQVNQSSPALAGTGLTVHQSSLLSHTPARG